MTRSQTAVLILQEISNALHIPTNSIEAGSDLLDNGATSITLIRLHHALMNAGIHLPLERLISGTSITQLLDEAGQQSTFSTGFSDHGCKRKAAGRIEPTTKRISSGKPASNNAAMLKYNVQYPMTEMQLALLQSSLSNHGSNIISYHETHALENVSALKDAWRKVLQSIPLLNSTYTLEQSGAYIVEREHQPLDWKEVIVEDTESYMQEINNQDLDTPIFGNHFRVVTLRPKDQIAAKSRVIWKVHHSLIDGYAHTLLLSKLEKAFLGAELGETIPFIRFADGLRDIQENLEASGLEYWARQRSEHEQPSSILLLPAPIPPSTPQTKQEFFETQLDHSDLDCLCKDVGITFPTLYYASWTLTLAIYMDSSDVLFGTVLSGRSLPIEESTSVIGPTINTLPISIKIDSRLSVRHFLRNVFKSTLELSSMQWTTPKHGFSRDFQTALNIQNQSHTMREHLLPLEPPFSMVHSDVPLQVEIVRSTTDLIRFHYHTKFFDRCQIERLSRILLKATTILQSPDASIKSCLDSLVDDTHRRSLCSLGNWDGAFAKTSSVKQDLVTLFLETALKYPSAVAIEKGSSTMTYEELDLKSSVVAFRISCIVEARDVVCVNADRSFNWIIAIYGVLKAGAIYCPLAEDLPTSARNSNFAASGAKLFITGNNHDMKNKPASCNKTISIEDILNETQKRKVLDKYVSTGMSPDRGAYLCFTSGSTGKPKGVLCQHRGLVAFQRDFNIRLRARQGWKIAQVMSPAFDGSIHEIFSTFSYGATLLLRDESPFSHLSMADAAILTPSLARALSIDSFPNLKTVYFVGEAVTQDLCDSWASKKTVFNMYGPTEATCGATVKQLYPNQPVSLGKPNSSSRIYILNGAQNLVPRGVIGEIYIAGVQVASGYLRNKEESKSRFLPDSICPELGEKMYKTGDKAYWNETGELMFVGRSDRQVKLHGFRIDLDGLETQFLRAGNGAIGVAQVAITLSDGDLVAYVQPENLDLTELRKELSTRISGYAIPRRIVAVESFPMTPAGKRDYKKLESFQPRQIEHSNDTFIAEATSLESIVILAVRETLAIPKSVLLDSNSDFFELGLTSISFLFLSHRLSKNLCRKVSLQSIMHSRTPRELVMELSRAEFSTSVEDDDGPVLGETNASPIESDWWHKYRHHHDTSAFNVGFASKLGPKVDVRRLASAWDAVLSHHRILRCNYRLGPDSKIFRIYENVSPKTLLVENFDINLEIHVPFDLEKDSLIRVICSSTLMIVVASHILCDLTTLNKLLEQVADIYAGRDPRYIKVDYSQTRWKRSLSFAQQAFWTKCLQNVRQFPLPACAVRNRVSWVGTSHLFSISEFTFKCMKEYTAEKKITMHQLSLAAVALALQPDQKDQDIVIGAPYLNRNSENELQSIGLFLQPLPIRIKYDHGASSSNLDLYVQAVQLASREAVSHAVPFDQLLSLLKIQATYPDNELLDVMVTFHEAEHMPRLPIPDTEPIHIWTKGAKFKLMAELIAVENGITLRLEYSTECFTASGVQVIGNRIVEAVQRIVGRKSL